MAPAPEPMNLVFGAILLLVLLLLPHFRVRKFETCSTSGVKVCRRGSTDKLEAKAAANAALARIEGRDKKEFNTSLAAIQAQVRRVLEVEPKVKEEQGTATTGDSTSGLSEDKRKYLAVKGILCSTKTPEIVVKQSEKVRQKTHQDNLD
ncbi:conserved hypothetical protein [Culex quinquefasciatus]|uniref:Uncharacterized protein n=1 Tax=Culex quinquefasciatus TaxID=7176 RepID=B0WJU4_CULQU|nr:conserved hypothetical protein [Culex quinquefasciatus]|eukprot:XP_001848978.1 conserved hypothetical protein [Culex quinquefasciatus]